MVRSMPWKMALIAVGAFASFASFTGRLQADDSEGVIRISNQAQGGQAQGSTSGGYSEGECPNCQSGSSCGYRGCGGMQPRGYVNGVLGWLNPWSGVGTYSPDHGYAPPGKVHTPHPQQVAYNKAFPDSWTGQPGAGGMGGQRAVAIYMPTDTTQLGYYYQAAPRWHANPGMTPPTPVPSQWHRDLCQGQGQCRGQGCRMCRGQGQGNCPNCRGNSSYPQLQPGEQIVSEGAIQNQPQPAEPNPAPAMESIPQPLIQDPAPPSIPAAVKPNSTATPLEKIGNPNLQPIN